MLLELYNVFVLITTWLPALCCGVPSRQTNNLAQKFGHRLTRLYNTRLIEFLIPNLIDFIEFRCFVG